MANTKSAKKNIRKTLKRTLHNRGVKSALRTLKKRVTEAVDSKEAPKVKGAVSHYISALDKAAKHRTIHPNKARRHKAACAKLLVS